MNLRSLKIFEKVCETGNMSQAAEELYMTQPAVSQAVAKLEKEFQIKLFERLNKKLVLTHAGNTLLDYSRQILLLVNEAEDNLQDIANMKQGKLRIGASMTIGTYLLPSILKQFTHRHNQIEINFTIDNTSLIEEKVLNNAIDIGLVEGPTSSAKLEVAPFFTDQLCLVCSTNHPWSRNNKIPPEQLTTENLIMREPGSGTREVIENILTSHQLEYKINHVLNNIEAIKKAVRANLGVTILPEIAVQDELKRKKIAKVQVAGIDFNRKFNIIHHTDKYKSQLFLEFIEYLQQTTNNN